MKHFCEQHTSIFSIVSFVKLWKTNTLGFQSPATKIGEKKKDVNFI